MYNTMCIYFKLKHISMYCTSMYMLELCTAINRVSYPYLQYVSFYNENALFTKNNQNET